MSLSLDFTGSLPANKVTAESVVLTPTTLTAIYATLTKGPFFNNNLVVTFTDLYSGVTTPMTRGVDYDSTFNFPQIGISTNAQIYGALCFYDTSLNGTITVTYQALGGQWSFDLSQISSYLDSNLCNPGIAYPALVPNIALTRADNVTPLVLNSQANIAYAQGLVTKYPSGFTLNIKYLPLITNGSKNIANQRFPTIINVPASTAGVTSPGCVLVTIKNNGAVAMSAAGGTLQAGETATFTARLGETIYPVNYATIAGGSALITTLV